MQFNFRCWHQARFDTARSSEPREICAALTQLFSYRKGREYVTAGPARHNHHIESAHSASCMRKDLRVLREGAKPAVAKPRNSQCARMTKAISTQLMIKLLPP